MSRKDERLAQLRRTIDEVTPTEAFARLRDGAVLIDVRESEETDQGAPTGATLLPRGYLELRIETITDDPDREILLLCGGGVRSLFAAADLQQLGFGAVRSVQGGFRQWKEEGLPIEVPRGLDRRARQRYERHLRIQEVGEAGQQHLLDARVLLIGAGGLGCPAALYLAAAGVGTLGIVDDDVVDRSNLQRQVLHGEDTVGLPKIDSARATLRRLNPDVEVQGHPVRLTDQNAQELLAPYDVIVDGSDNFQTRYVVNQHAVRLGKPVVYGAVQRFEGHVSVFWPGAPKADTPCYRCVFPEPPPPELAPNCAEAGVLGVLPGVVGMLQATEAIKLVLGLGEPLTGRLLIYDALRASFLELEQRRNPDCRDCRP